MNHAPPVVVRRHKYAQQACQRCGISRTVNLNRPSTGLCRDCYDVCRELAEVGRWTQ
jgi:ribosomal protein S14